MCELYKFLSKNFRFQKNWDFGALGAYVLFGGLGLLGAYIIGGPIMLTIFRHPYIGTGSNFAWPPKLTALIQANESFVIIVFIYNFI
jgi:hypothetical protein